MYKTQEANLPRVTLQQLLADIPRSQYFISYCESIGINYLDELTEDVLLQAHDIPRLGEVTILEIQQRIEGSSNYQFDERSLYAVFSEVPKGKIFLNFLETNGITTIEELLEVNFDVLDIKGITEAKLNDIKDVLYRHLIENRDYEIPEYNIHDDNLTLPLYMFVDEDFNQYHDINDNVASYFEEMSVIKYARIVPFLDTLSLSPIERFELVLEGIDTRSKRALLRRVRQDTYESIGEEFEISRERVRQILEKTKMYLEETTHQIAYVLSEKYTKPIRLDYVKKQPFSQKSNYKIFNYILQETPHHLTYIDFAEAFVPNKNLEPDYETLFHEKTHQIIEEGCDFDDYIENVAQDLEKWGLGFIEPIHLEEFLNQQGYVRHGDFIHPKKASYAFICLNAIEKYYDFSIKLDENEDNEDLNRLRKIIKRKYNDAPIAQSNRSLSVRLAEHMVLTDRGRYAPVSKVKFNKKVIRAIYEYIQNQDQSTFYFSELYEIYKDELKDINRYFLQGIFKLLYSEHFTFDKDSLVKRNVPKETIDQRIIDYVLENGDAVNNSELKKLVPGLSNFQISFILERNPKLINWSLNEINHLKNIKVTKEDFEDVIIVVDEYIENIGYISAPLLYETLLLIDSPLLDIFDNYRQLFYVFQYFFREEYDIRRLPHITRKGYIQNISLSKIMEKILEKDEVISRKSVVEFLKTFRLPIVNMTNVVNMIEDGYLRVNEDKFQRLEISPKWIDEFNDWVKEKVNREEYFAVNAVEDFNGLPKTNFEWNKYSLDSMIKKFANGYSYLEPKVTDRRWIRTIVTYENLYESFEDLIVSTLRQKGIKKISAFDLQNLLVEEDLIYDSIPKEIYDGEKIKFIQNQFQILD